MEGKCKFERVTKYKFLECFAFVCNICSKVREDHENNGEETKKKKKNCWASWDTAETYWVTVDTVEKSWKNVVLAKYEVNDMLMYNRSGKHAINLKCLLCCCCAKDIDKLNCFKSEWIEGSTNYLSSNVLDHAVSEQHQICFNKCTKDKGLYLMEITKKYIKEWQKNIAHGFAKTSEKSN